MIVNLASIEVDISNVVPLRLKDVRALAAQGLDLNKAGDWSQDQLLTFVHYVLSKANPAITREQAEELPVPDLATFVQAAMGIKSPLATRT